MNRRQGFTITELLVSLALIIFIMLILTEAFSEGLETFRKLKAIGDMQGRMRTASITLRRDLVSDHFGNVINAPRLSDQALNLLVPLPAEPTWVPPQEGYFRIWQQPPPQPPPPLPGAPPGPGPGNVADGTHNSILEGTEVVSGVGINLPSTRATTHVLQFTCRRPIHTAARDNYRTVGVPVPALTATPPGKLDTQGPVAYQASGIMNTPWYEVTYFLKPALDVTGTQLTTTSGTNDTPLFTLYRRERAISNHGEPKTTHEKVELTADTARPDVSTGSADPAGTPPGMKVNQPVDVTDPRCRFGMHHADASVAGLPVPPNPPPAVYPPEFRPAWALADVLPVGDARIGDDILLTDVISFDVKVLQQGWDPATNAFIQNYVHPTFVDLPPAALNRNKTFKARGWSVFDTWCAKGSAQYPTDAFASNAWNTADQDWSLPLPIRIHAIQITFRVWDQKTEQSRQVSLVVDM